MKTTEDCINYVSNHPWLKKGFSKLKNTDLEIIISCLNIPFQDKTEAMLFCNRLFMDDRNKPKQWTTISEMISSAISYRYN